MARQHVACATEKNWPYYWVRVYDSEEDIDAYAADTFVLPDTHQGKHWLQGPNWTIDFWDLYPETTGIEKSAAYDSVRRVIGGHMR